MSLINKVLTDLEARSGTPGYGQPMRPVYEDLRPVRPVAGRMSRSRTTLLVVLALSVGAAAYGAIQWGAVPWQAEAPIPVSLSAAAPSLPVESPASMPPASVAASTPTEATITSPPAAVAAKNLPDSAMDGSVQTEPRKTVRPRKRENTGLAAVLRPSSDTDSAIDKKARPLTALEQAENAYRAAGAALKRQDRAQAERALKNALSLNAKHAPARELYAGLLLEQGRSLEAQQLLERGLAKVPEHYPFAQLLARVYVEHGAEHKALAVLQKARASGQADADFLALSATLAQRAGRHADAIADFGAALRLHPVEGRWWAGLGISLETDQRWSEAREAYENARASGRLNATLARHVDQRLAALKDRGG
jgi:MSHA biogenesis protein MshN